MSDEIRNTVLEIDKQIRKHMWFDFHVFRYDVNQLIIAGSIDLLYYHSLEVVFEDIFFVSAFFQGWHSDTENPVFELVTEEREMNRKYEIEEGYELFIFKTEDYNNDVVIAAKKVSFNTDIVFYYDRPDLKDNERIADFVKKKRS